MPLPNNTMKNLRLPAIIMAALVIGFLFLLGASSHILPDRVASHFDAAGRANGWTDRQAFIFLMGGIGLIFPIVFVALFFIIGFAPGWLRARPSEQNGTGAPGVTFTYLMRRSFWFASMTLCFIAAVQGLVIEANTASPPRLQTTTLVVVITGFVVGVMFWSGSLLYHFLRARRTSQPI